MEPGAVTAHDVDALDDGAQPRPSRLRQYLTVSWVVTIVAFTLARFFVAKGTIGDDINIWVFGIIDLVTAVPYAVGVAKVVGGIVDRDAAAVSRWGAIAGFSFIAPYLYVAWDGRDASFPPIVWIVLVLLVVIFGTNALVGIRRKVNEARAARGADAPSPAVG